MTLRAQHQGFSLVEVTLALGIFAVCLLPILGLLPVGLNSERTSIQQTTATSILTAVEADLRNTLASTTTSLTPVQKTSPQFSISIPDPGTGSTTSVFTLTDSLTRPDPTVPGDTPLYRVQVTLTPPTAGFRTATNVAVFVSWPALADPSTVVPPTHYSGFVEAAFAMDRN